MGILVEGYKVCFPNQKSGFVPLKDWESMRTGLKVGEGTAIVFGAGASKHLGLPLADDLLPEMFAYANKSDWNLWGGLDTKKNLYEFLRPPTQTQEVF